MENYLLVTGCIVLVIAFVLLCFGISILSKSIDQGEKTSKVSGNPSKEILVFFLLDSSIALSSLVSSSFIMNTIVKISVLAITIASLLSFTFFVFKILKKRKEI